MFAGVDWACVKSGITSVDLQLSKLVFYNISLTWAPILRFPRLGTCTTMSTFLTNSYSTDVLINMFASSIFFI